MREFVALAAVVVGRHQTPLDVRALAQRQERIEHRRHQVDLHRPRLTQREAVVPSQPARVARRFAVATQVPDSRRGTAQRAQIIQRAAAASTTPCRRRRERERARDPRRVRCRLDRVRPRRQIRGDARVRTLAAVVVGRHQTPLGVRALTQRQECIERGREQVDLDRPRLTQREAVVPSQSPRVASAIRSRCPGSRPASPYRSTRPGHPAQQPPPPSPAAVTVSVNAPVSPGAKDVASIVYGPADSSVAMREFVP